MQIKTVLFLILGATATAATVFGAYKYPEYKKQKALTARFDAFTQVFAKAEMPYEVQPATLNMFVTRVFSYDEYVPDTTRNPKTLGRAFAVYIPDMIDGEFSRSGPDEYVADKILAENKQYKAVVYKSHSGFDDNYNYILATYSPFGRLITTVPIAYSDGYESLTACKITALPDDQLKIAKLTYKNQFLLPIERNDFYSDKNKITNTILTNTEDLIITREGKLQDLKTGLTQVIKK